MGYSVVDPILHDPRNKPVTPYKIPEDLTGGVVTHEIIYHNYAQCSVSCIRGYSALGHMNAPCNNSVQYGRILEE